jgi:hypothetical protein
LSIAGAAEPVIERNIFLDHPVTICIGKIADQSPFAAPTGTVNVRQNIFWSDQKSVVRRVVGPDNEMEMQIIDLPAEDGNQRVDPGWRKDADALPPQADSPTRKGALHPLSWSGPWPLQPEERAIIPDSNTRDSRSWKHPDRD